MNCSKFAIICFYINNFVILRRGEHFGNVVLSVEIVQDEPLHPLYILHFRILNKIRQELSPEVSRHKAAQMENSWFGTSDTKGRLPKKKSVFL